MGSTPHAVPWQPEHAAPRRRGRGKQGIDQSYQHQPAIQQMSKNVTGGSRLSICRYSHYCAWMCLMVSVSCHPAENSQYVRSSCQFPSISIPFISSNSTGHRLAAGIVNLVGLWVQRQGGFCLLTNLISHRLKCGD